MSAIGQQVVVDASVALKWFLNEPRAVEARLLLSGSHSLSVPDLIYGEIGNALWKRVRRKEITIHQGEQVLKALASIPWSVRSSSSLADAAFRIAVGTGCTVYDALYVALAVASGALFVTADEKLVRQLSQSPLAEHVLGLEQVPQP
jgi:predicted nucleic acid-binding protein